MAQLVEHILGKDEVPGSNPGSSYKNKHFLLGSVYFWVCVRMTQHRFEINPKTSFDR